MSKRQAFLDRAVGETRGVVTLDGRPEHLIVVRDTDAPGEGLGSRHVARVRTVEAAFASAFLDLEGGGEALLPLRSDAPRPVRGTSVEIEIRAEARGGKLATAWLLGEAEGAPRLLAPGPSLADELRRITKGDKVVEGFGAREAADEAEAEALAVVHALQGGGSVAIEPTRALTAVDVDTGERQGSDSKRVSRQSNLTAIAEAARLLRLKGLGGLTVLDLAGRGHDGAAILGAVRNAFSPDNPGVAIGPISRFGTLELTIPRRRRPVIERLTGPEAAALRLARLLEREGRANPGSRLVGRCAPGAAAAFDSLRSAMTERLGARYDIEARPDWPAERLEVFAA